MAFARSTARMSIRLPIPGIDGKFPTCTRNNGAPARVYGFRTVPARAPARTAIVRGRQRRR